MRTRFNRPQGPTQQLAPGHTISRNAEIFDASLCPDWQAQNPQDPPQGGSAWAKPAPPDDQKDKPGNGPEGDGDEEIRGSQ